MHGSVNFRRTKLLCQKIVRSSTQKSLVPLPLSHSSRYSGYKIEVRRVQTESSDLSHVLVVGGMVWASVAQSFVHVLL